MARMIPDVPSTSERFHNSSGEAEVYTALRALPDPIVVIHGLRTLTRHEDQEQPANGEADFVILDPARGILVVEVKGGTVSYDPGSDQWSIRARRGRELPMKDPARRAENRLRDLRKKLKDDPGWATLALPESPGGHAVVFSELDAPVVTLRPNLPHSIVGGRAALADLSAWLDGVYRFWGASAAPGISWLHHAVRVLAQPFEVQPRLGVVVARDDRRLDYWTDQQWQALQGTYLMRKLGVAGGAGTGKTLLAMRRAQELAREGERTLLLCFNALLGDHLKHESMLFARAEPEAGARLLTMTFHELCKWWAIDKIGAKVGRDLLAEARRGAHGEDEAHVVRPYALALAFNHELPDFQAIVIDEAQDFRDAYWLPITQLHEGRRTRLLVFYDPNQRLLNRSRKLPVELIATYVLTKNCRSARSIHAAAYSHYQGPTVAPNDVEGQAIERWEEADFDRAAARLLKELLRLIVEEKVPPEEIVVLLLDGRQREVSEKTLERGLKDRRLRLSLGVHFEKAKGCVRVETAGRFKGMEAAVVILWAQGWPGDEEERSFLYVGLSRARNLLAVLGPPLLVNRALAGPA
ncbi:MAG TPA: AAA family ATPase [Myxococcaceae bacterium]|nr:AAA family ATPase [Myxococcaceae bacterium]